MRKLENKTKYIIVAAFFAAFAFSNISLVQAAEIRAGEVIDLLNAERQKKNLTVLVENPVLGRAAKMKAEDMIKNDYFAHTSPQGKTPWYWFGKSGYDYKFAGENLAVNYSSAKDQHEAWMDSSSHRANILNASYREVGVAVVEGKIDGEKSLVTVQMFGTPMAAAANPQKAVPAEPETKAVPEVKSAEVAALPEKAVPAENLPVEKNPEILPVGIPETEESSAFSRDRIFGLVWLIALGMLLVAILTNSIMSLGKSYEIIKEALRKKDDPRRIMVRYEGIVKSIRINMQHAGSTHPARGRPG